MAETQVLRPVKVRQSDGTWQVQAAAGWRPIRNPLVAGILDAWPDAEVEITVKVRHE